MNVKIDYNGFRPEYDASLQKAGEQVAYYALTKGAMGDDEQWEYVTKTWPNLPTMSVDKVLHYAGVAIRHHFAAAARLLKDFA